jgi:DNA-binding CsgD family transcriptional regulator
LRVFQVPETREIRHVAYEETAWKMGRLKEQDIAAVVDCLRDVYAITDLATFAEHVIARLRKVVLCSGIIFGNCDLRTMRSEFVADHPDASTLCLDQIIANLPRDHQHPYWPHYLRTGDPRATKLSDFMSRRELHSKGFYTELYNPLRAEAEIGCMLVIAPNSNLTYIAAIRDGQDFTERDRTVLNLLQPHLSQAYRNAGALTTLGEELRLARRMIESLDHAVIVRSHTGSIRFVTARARDWLKEYFPLHRRTDQLPATLERWLERQCIALGKRDDVPGPIGPLVVERDGKKLIVRSVLDRDESILILAEEWTSLDPGSLDCLGLTRREAEVSAWLSEGKTNNEIGQILGVHPLTVKKHVEHIFQKLGVENRTAAAGLIINQQRKGKFYLG